MTDINSSKNQAVTAFFVIVFFSISLESLPSVTRYTLKAIEICADKVLPSLFFFIVLSGILLRTEAHAKIPAFIYRPVCRAFRISPPSVAAVILGMLCGFPIGGKIAVDLYKNQEIDRSEAERLIAFSNNTGPAFTVAGIGTGILGNTGAGLMIYFLQITSAFCVAFFLRKNGKISEKDLRSRPSQIFSQALCGSIYDAAWSCVSICGFIIFFYTSSGILSELFPVSEIKVLFSALLEVSSGAAAASCLPVPFSFSVAAFSVGWSGLSVHMQTEQFVSSTDLSMKKYYISKMFCGLFCGSSAFFLHKIIAVYDTSEAATSKFPVGIGYFILVFIVLLFLLGFIISKLEKRKGM